MAEYFQNIYNGIKTLISGMSLSLHHFNNRKKLVATLQYPHEKWPIPERDIGHSNEDYNVIRSRLHVDINDCISCRMCERACPVDCIKIEDVKPKKGTDFDCGVTSNDTQKKLLVSRFSIDMSECMYCNLCVYPCPEECIYMVGGPNDHKHEIDYEFSKRERGNLIYEFATATDEEILEAGGSDYLEKKNKKADLLDQAMRVHEIEKEGENALKEVKSTGSDSDSTDDIALDITLLKKIENRISKAYAKKVYRAEDASGKSINDIAAAIQEHLESKGRLTDDVKKVINLYKGTAGDSGATPSLDSPADSAPAEIVEFNLDSLKNIESRVVRGIAKKIYKKLDSEGKSLAEICMGIKVELESKDKYSDDVSKILQPVLDAQSSPAEPSLDSVSGGEINFDLDSLKEIENRVVRGIAKKIYKNLESEGKTLQEISKSIKDTLEEKGKYTDDVKKIIE